MIKIISMPVGMDACSYYRVKKPLQGLAQYTQAVTHVVDVAKDSMTDLVLHLPNADIIMIRPGAEEGMRKIKQIPELKGMTTKWVLDIDDNTDLISPYSQFYSSYGTEEYSHGDIEVWKEGKSGFSVVENVKRVESLKKAMREVDAVMVTTDKLAEYASQFNKNVIVNKNTIDFNHWWRLNNKMNKPLKVVWQGSPSHFEDFYPIKKQLNKLMNEYDFDMYMMGSQYKGIFLKKHLKRVHALPWVPFEAHSYRMMSMQADIAIIPLADLPFNYYKSSIKWYEMSAMGVPSVVSNVTPYKEDIKHNKTALAYNNPEEFYEQMKILLDNKGIRYNIGNAAHQWVKDNRNLEIESNNLYKSLEKCLK